MPSFQNRLEQARLKEYSTPTLCGPRLSQRCFESFCSLVFRYYCPLSVYGREHLPPPPFIFCSNHSSHMDSTALMYASGLGFQRFGMIAAQDYFFEHGVRKHLLPLLTTLIPTKRKANREEITRLLVHCYQFVNNGQRCLILYPEGTRSRNGKLKKIKRGAALLSTELRLPIVPAYIRGSFESLPVGTFLPRPHRIEVHFAPPLKPDPPQSEASGSAYARLGEQLTQSLHTLRDHAEA